MGKYHYDGDCSINKFAMQLSGWCFLKSEIDDLPDGYVEDDDFGPRVAKNDWFEMLAMFPVWIGFLVMAGVAALAGIFWFSCYIKGLHISGQSKHSCRRFFIKFLLILLLLPLVAGLYLSARANHLLRKNSKEQARYRDVGNADALEHNEVGTYRAAEGFQNNTLPDEYKNHMDELKTELDKAMANELIVWQQLMAQNEQNNFKLMKHLFANKLFYENSLKKLREVAYELVILGIEMDDYLRDFLRVGLHFLKSKTTFDAKNRTNIFPPFKQLNVWHLSALYYRYLHAEECFVYLMEAYSNITHIQESIAKMVPNFVEIENLNENRLPVEYRSNEDSQEKRAIPKSILFVALAMVFVTAALIYMLFMMLGFSIFRYYEETNFLIKCFIFLSLFSIVMLALLAVLHFLLTMVLHTGICHNDNRDAFIRSVGLSSVIEPLECAPNVDSNEMSFPASEILETLLKREIPLFKISHLSFTDDYFKSAEDPLQEEWYEYDMQAFLKTKDGMPFIAYVKEHYVAGTPQAKIFRCKLESLDSLIKQELYAKEFIPNATLLYETVRGVNARAQDTASPYSMAKLLEDALTEVYAFEQFYSTTKDNFFETLHKKNDIILQKYKNKYPSTPATCAPDYKKQMRSMRATNSDTKCGCREDYLMIYAIGGALVVLSLFASMILSMLLYKLNKRGPPLSTPDENASAKATQTPSAPPVDAASVEAQNAHAPTKDRVVNIKGDIVTRSANDGHPQPRHSTPLINTVNFIPPMGYQQQYPQMVTQPCCPPNSQQMAGCCKQNDGVILPLRSRTQVDGAGTSAEAQLVGGGTTGDKTVTVMVFQGPKERQPLVTYPPPAKLKR